MSILTRASASRTDLRSIVATSNPGSSYGFGDVLSIDDMLADLRASGDRTWRDQVEQIRGWSNGLFDGLV